MRCPDSSTAITVRVYCFKVQLYTNDAITAMFMNAIKIIKPRTVFPSRVFTRTAIIPTWNPQTIEKVSLLLSHAYVLLIFTAVGNDLTMPCNLSCFCLCPQTSQTTPVRKQPQIKQTTQTTETRWGSKMTNSSVNMIGIHFRVSAIQTGQQQLQYLDCQSGVPPLRLVPPLGMLRLLVLSLELLSTLLLLVQNNWHSYERSVVQIWKFPPA